MRLETEARWGRVGAFFVTLGVGFYSKKEKKTKESSEQEGNIIWPAPCEEPFRSHVDIGLQADKGRGRKTRLEGFADVQVRDDGVLD